MIMGRNSKIARFCDAVAYIFSIRKPNCKFQNRGRYSKSEGMLINESSKFSMIMQTITDHLFNKMLERFYGDVYRTGQHR